MLNKSTAITALFLAISIVAAISLIASTINYLAFYRAMQEINLKILDVNVLIGENNANITLVFSLTNPTNYVGLKLRELSYTLYYEADREKIALLWDTVYYAENPIDVGPYWNKTYERQVHLDINKEKIMSFVEFYESHQGNVKWILSCTSIFVTFTGKIDVPLTASFIRKFKF